MVLRRRDCLALLASLPVVAATAETGVRFAASWREAEGDRLGLLQRSGSALRATHSVELPTRAHGLLQQGRTRVLAVARRPGDWLLRWDAAGGQAAWLWAEPGRSFNGHVRASADGRRVFTTETDTDSGQGLVGVRDAASLRKIGEWPTHGMDPHDLRFDADGTLVVANGGIATTPETGRLKLALDRMDSSLVRLDGASGALRGQWRLADGRLGMRHLAWSAGAGSRVLGIALQAEHDDAQVRAAAPVLALFDGSDLRTAAAGQPLSGYGGDIAPVAGGFAVSCPRSHGLALFDAQGRWQRFVPARSACALAVQPRADALWAGGPGDALRLTQGTHDAFTSSLALDNHWLVLAG